MTYCGVRNSTTTLPVSNRKNDLERAPSTQNDFVLLKRDLARDSGQTVDLCLAEPLRECVISENLLLRHLPHLLRESAHCRHG